MKKQLLTSTALVATGVLAVSGPALAQGKPTLTLGGSTEQIFGVGSNSDAFDAINGQRVGFDQHTDGEIFFKGAVTLDNGIKIQTRIEMEANSTVDDTAGKESNITNGAPGSTGDGDLIDEHWIRISGSFGEVRLGSGDAAAQAMTTGYLGTWATGVGQNLAFDTGDWITNPGTVGASTIGRIDLTSDAEHISYFTPRFSGFQAGISYIPSTEEDVNNQRALTSAGDTDGWSLGLNYVGKFSGVGIGIATGYGASNESTVNQTDDEVWGIAGRVDFQGFRIAVSWVDNDSQETKSTGVTARAGQETFEVGVRYTFGPNAVSLSHLSAETTGTSAAAGDGDETKSTFIAYRRTLGPGVFWKVTGMLADFDDNAPGAAAGNSNDGEALTTSIQVRF
ncbi:MAG: porin [Alphaproteobacteria bacterium]